VPESPLLFGARDGHVLRFSGLARWGWGLRRLIFGWVVLVMARVTHAQSSPAESASVFSAGIVAMVFSCLGLLFQFTSVIFRHYGTVLMTFLLDLPFFFVIGCALLFK
jgi:hypothetical protein